MKKIVITVITAIVMVAGFMFFSQASNADSETNAKMCEQFRTYASMKDDEQITVSVDGTPALAIPASEEGREAVEQLMSKYNCS